MNYWKKNDGKTPIRTTVSGRVQSDVEGRKEHLLSKGWRIVRSGVSETKDVMILEVRKRTITPRMGKSSNLVDMVLPVNSYWYVMESPLKAD